MKFANIFLFIFPLAIETLSYADQHPANPIDTYKVITLEGEDIPWILGWKLEEISLAAMIDGAMEPIPFQIDQYNTGGAIYFENWDIPMAGKSKQMDATDKILFLYKDAGARRPAHEPYDGEVVAEIVTHAPNGVERFVYLVRDSRLRSEEQYVRYSAEIGLVETDFYSLRYNRNNHLKWDEFSYEGYKGQRPLDSLKLRLNTGIVSSLVNTELNNDQIIALPTSEIIGPIRSVTQLEVTMYVLSIPIMKMSMQIHHYPNSITFDVRGIIPELRRRLMVNPTLTMSVDANNLLGAATYTSAWPDQPGIVDGVIDENEKKMIKAGLDPANNWIWVTSKRNLDIVAFVDYLGKFNEPMSLLYEDDLIREDPPEVFPGQMPNVGYGIEDFPMSGLIGLVVSMYISEGFSGDPEKFSPYLRTLPDVEIRTF